MITQRLKEWLWKFEEAKHGGGVRELGHATSFQRVERRFLLGLQVVKG
jgi:hypothetical protein